MIRFMVFGKTFSECEILWRQSHFSKKFPNLILTETNSGKYIANLVGQRFPGPNTDYVYVCSSLLETQEAMQAKGLKSLALPFNLGCGIGGGNWNIVERIILEIFENSKEEVVIYKLEG